MKITALLPMKANSERVKGKNFRLFGNKPLFKWILDTLEDINFIDEIVINTDAEPQLIEKGFEETKKTRLRKRKKSICGDDVSMNIILKDDIENTKSDLYLMTHTTNPFLSKNTIEDAVAFFLEKTKKENCDSLFSVDKVQERFFDENAKPLNHDLTNLIKTQDITPWFKENSNLYIFTKESFLSSNSRIGKNPIMYEMSSYESLDIDNQHDWDLGISMLKFYDESQK